MAPIKFEEHIKDKLEQREIQPSTESWDTLSSRLNASEKRSGNRWWFPAAAAVAVIMIASIFFVNQEQHISNPIVETPAKEDVQNDAGINDPKQPVQLSSEINNEAIQEEIKKPEPIKKDAKQTERIAVQNRNIETVLEENAIVEQSQSRRALIEPIENQKAEVVETTTRPLYEKAQDVLAKINQEEKSMEDYTEAEVDALLAEAAQKISNDQKANGLLSVNADALLADVEYEVDQSFRKEVFDFLKEEFLKAKTAVATRND